MSSSDKSKLNGIATSANNYSLPTASSSTLGGVKVGSNINISGGTISVPLASTSVAGVVEYDNNTIKKNSSGQLYVNTGAVLIPLPIVRVADLACQVRLSVTQTLLVRGL